MRRRLWLLIIVGPSAIFLVGSLIAMLVLPHPVPKHATPAQRLYLANCATCHGADGRGSWRATVFLMRPGDLTNARTLSGFTDDYLLGLIRDGGATRGRPGMPAFGYHLSEADIRELIAYVRSLPTRTRREPRR